MLLKIKDEKSREGMIIKVQELIRICRPGNTGETLKRRCYKCLFARPGQVLHASITAPDGENVTIADLLRLLSMERKGRHFLKGFKNLDIGLNAVSIDTQTDVNVPMGISP